MIPFCLTIEELNGVDCYSDSNLYPVLRFRWNADGSVDLLSGSQSIGYWSTVKAWNSLVAPFVELTQGIYWVHLDKIQLTIDV